MESSDEAGAKISVIRPRSDEGPIQLRSYVIGKKGELFEASETLPGIDIWNDLSLDVLVFTVLKCEEGNAVRYEYIPGVGNTLYSFLPQGHATNDQNIAVDEILDGFGLEIALSDSVKKMMVKVLSKYVVF